MIRKRKNFFDLLKESLGIFSYAWARLFIIIFIFSFISFFFFIAFLFLGAFLGWAVSGNLSSRFFLATFPLLLSFIFIGLFFLFAQITIIKAIQSVDQKNPLGAGVSYWTAIPLLGPYCVVCFLGIMRMILWGLLFIVPGIVFGIFYSFSCLALLIDGHKGTKALVHSRKIIQPAFWNFLGYCAGIVLLMFVISTGAEFTVKLLFGLLMPGWADSVNAIFFFLINAGTLIYSTIFFYLLYGELKSRAGMA